MAEPIVNRGANIHPDGTQCPATLTDQPPTPKDVQASQGVYHKDGTRCPLWPLTRPHHPSSGPQRHSTDRTTTTDCLDAVGPENDHPLLKPILSWLSAKDITSKWIKKSLLPFPRVCHGTDAITTDILNSRIPKAIENADLLVQALKRWDHDPAFAQKYHAALLRRRKALREGDYAGAESDEFCDRLAPAGSEITVFLWVLLQSREKGGLGAG